MKRDGVVGTVVTFGTYEVYISATRCGHSEWDFLRVVTLVTFGTFVTGDAVAVEGSSTGYWARQGWPGRA